MSSSRTSAILTSIEYLEQHPDIKKYMYNGGDPITKDFDGDETKQSFGQILARAIILCNYIRIYLEWPMFSENDPYNHSSMILFAHVHPFLEEVRTYNKYQLVELLRVVVSNMVILASLNLPKLMDNKPGSEIGPVSMDEYDTINSGIVTGIIRYSFETEETYEHYKITLAGVKNEREQKTVVDATEV